MYNKYTTNVDFELLKGNGIEVVMHQPWQLGLFHEELSGKYVWYPRKGTLMYEDEDKRSSKIGEYHDTDEIIQIINKKIYN